MPSRNSPPGLSLAAKLRPGGEFRFGTDHPVYCRWAMMIMNARRDFEWLVESAADVLEELGMSSPTSPAPAPLPPLPADEANLLEAMGYAPIDMDSLSEQVDTPVELISTLLLKLELGGHISRLPGGLFQRLA